MGLQPTQTERVILLEVLSWRCSGAAQMTQ